MIDLSELRQAVALLACAMASGEVLSACKQSAAQPAPTVTPEPSSASAASDVESLRRAAAVIEAWHRRDPAQTERVLREHGIFACDANTTACIAARQTFTVPPTVTPPQSNTPPLDEAERARLDAAAAAAAAAMRVPTRHPGVRHPNDRRVPLA